MENNTSQNNTSDQYGYYEAVNSSEIPQRFAYNYTQDPLARYLRDRGLQRALQHISSVLEVSAEEMHRWRVLIVCGGIGGEGTLLANQGFSDVTVSDLSRERLELCRKIDKRLQTTVQDAENMDLESGAYDLVLVQAGLHELPQPVLGFTEMLRVSRKVVVVVEPHLSISGKLLGTKWERHGHEDNYVIDVNYAFRWNQTILEQVTRSYLLSEKTYVKAIRFWDHDVYVGKAVSKLPAKHRLSAAKAIYRALDVLPGTGNAMAGVVIKYASPLQTRGSS